MTKFVDGRGVAGVVGTEIPIWQSLTWEMTRLFIEPFITGRLTAGQALFAAQRYLLCGKRNPLGLAYTPYAPSHLAIDINNDGQCQILP